MLQEEEEKDQALQAKANLSIPLVREAEEDRRLATLLTYRSPDCTFLAPHMGMLGSSLAAGVGTGRFTTTRAGWTEGTETGTPDSWGRVLEPGARTSEFCCQL